jgi:acyl-CoA dehydrogenase
MTMLETRADQGAIAPAVFGLGGVEAPAISFRAEAAAAVAAEHATEVDRDARFPGEAIAALKRHRLLGMAVPREFGGEGASMADVADVCFKLGRACSSAAMVFAMHQIKVACVMRHACGSAWHEAMLRRLCDEQMLLASSTTEGQNGGNVRSSAAAIESEADDAIVLDRESTVISYGAEADGIVTTARRSSEAAGSDQVLVVLLREHYRLEPVLQWDTLGMRGTCSAGFRLRARGSADQVLPVAYETIHSQTMTPVAHILWGAAWSGIAAAAVERAQNFIRKAARHGKGQLPPGAAHYTKAQSSLRVLRTLVQAGIVRYEAALADERLFGSLDFHAAMNLLKVDASEIAVATVMSAMRACGLSGYRNDGESSIGRHLRDILSSPIMINNDRILANLATTSLMSAVPTSLMD